MLHEALGLLRERELAGDCAAAWDEWSADPDNDVWQTAAADGLDASTAR